MTLQDRIIEGLNYYLVDQSRRCINKFSKECFYSGDSAGNGSSDGCFIGRHLKPEDRLKADDYLSGTMDSSVGALISEIDNIDISVPKWMMETDIEILWCLQSLHDTDANWDDNGLTAIGMAALKNICDMSNDLDFRTITHHLK